MARSICQVQKGQDISCCVVVLLGSYFLASELVEAGFSTTFRTSQA